MPSKEEARDEATDRRIDELLTQRSTAEARIRSSERIIEAEREDVENEEEEIAAIDTEITELRSRD